MNRMIKGLELNRDDFYDNTDNIRQFINCMTDDYKEKMISLQSEENKAYDQLKELDDKLCLNKRLQTNNNDLFSPNIKTYNTSEVNSEMDIINNFIKNLIEEKSRVQNGMECLNSLLTILDKNTCLQNDVGLNILNAQEKDRQRIARDLHDSIVQNLTGLVHKFELCTRLIDMDPTRTKLELAAMTGTVKSVINEIREIIYNLKPMSLDDLGFVVTLERYAKQFMMCHDIKVFVKYNHEERNVLPVIHLSLFRVVQEACNNAIKHAEASKIEINICYQENRITVSIADDGKGFDITKQMEVIPDRFSGYGLSIIRERIYLLSGTVDIQSNNKNGTIITVSVPLTKFEGENNE